MLDELLGGQGLGDALFQHRDVISEQIGVIHRIGRALRLLRSADPLAGHEGRRQEPDDERGDFDFVVFERGGRSPASAAAHRLAGGCQIEGIPYHLRFRLPGIDRWCDPHFTGPCPPVEAIIAGQARPAGVTELASQVIVGAAHGHHTPAHYELAFGRHLVSFRFGHSGLFEVGDRVTTDHALQLVTWDGVASFVVCDGDHHLEVLRP